MLCEEFLTVSTSRRRPELRSAGRRRPAPNGFRRLPLLDRLLIVGEMVQPNVVIAIDHDFAVFRAFHVRLAGDQFHAGLGADGLLVSNRDVLQPDRNRNRVAFARQALHHQRHGESGVAGEREGLVHLPPFGLAGAVDRPRVARHFVEGQAQPQIAGSSSAAVNAPQSSASTNVLEPRMNTDERMALPFLKRLEWVLYGRRDFASEHPAADEEEQRKWMIHWHLPPIRGALYYSCFL